MKTNNDTLHVPPFQSHKSVENVMDNWQEMFKNHIYNEPTSLVPLTVKPSAGMNCFYSIDFETDQVLNTVNTFLPRNLIDGALLAQCENKTSGIHLPQFNLALSSGQTQVAITQNIHNQCQRLGFYDYLADTAKVNWSLPVGRYLPLTTIMPMSFHPCIQAGANDRDLLICGMCSTNIRDIIFRPCYHQYACVECVNNPRFHNTRNQRDETGNYLKCPVCNGKIDEVIQMRYP